MKTTTASNLLILSLALTVTGTRAQVANSPGPASQPTATTAAGAVSLPSPTAPQVVDRGPFHKTWQWETYEAGPAGQIVTKVHSIKELASGMHYMKNSRWVESKDLIESSSSGAVAEHGPYHVAFAQNLNSAGAIDQQTKDSKRLRSTILGLAYYDWSGGSNVMIAQIQDSQGELIASNQVLYPGALTGMTTGHVRYTYKHGSFEQDVILEEQPPSPESLGLNPDTTEIEVLTEFFAPPDATVVEHTMPDSGLPDQDISWGAMRIGHGKAFDLAVPPNPRSQVCVRRQYVNVQGRQILVEGVPLKKILPQLSNLPLHAGIQSNQPKMASKTRMLPKMPTAQTAVKPIKLASKGFPEKGFVLDYVELNTDQTDFTFQGDTTYWIDGGVNLDGVTTIEGGAVIKADQNGGFHLYGTVVCETTTYRPAICTSINDDSVGESTSSDPYYTGSPSYNDIWILFDPGVNLVVHDMRFSYATIAFYDLGNNMDFWDCQFAQIATAVDIAFGVTLGLHNVLINEVAGFPPIYAEGANLQAENVTCDGAGGIVQGGPSQMTLTNCLITLIDPNNGQYEVSTDNINFVESANPTYQTVGGGSYYLAAGSPYRSAGTSSISPPLLADLAGKTTYPPVVFANTNFTSPMVLGPQALRENPVNPDLGYAYDPLDYVVGGCDLYSEPDLHGGDGGGLLLRLWAR